MTQHPEQSPDDVLNPQQDKNPLTKSIVQFGFDVRNFAVPRGYADLFGSSSKLLSAIVHIIELRKAYAVVAGRRNTSAAELLNVTRNAVYHRIHALGCSVDDLRDPANNVDDLLSPNDVIARIIEELKESCVHHGFPMDRAIPQIEKRGPATVRRAGIIDSSDAEFTL